jgi:hypothetical protein
MDPVSLVLAALVAGLTSGVTDTAKATVKDLYQAFKARLMPKVEADENARSAITALEKKPDSEGRQLAVKEELANLEVGKDSELVRLAQILLEQIDQKGALAGKYVITIQNSQGTVIGDKNTVTQTFSNKPEKAN